MVDYYLYYPCPGSTGTQFYSNVAPTYPGAFIRFDSGSDPLQYGKCYNVFPRTLEVPPTPLVSINWATVTYSFWNDKCDSCVEQAPCGDCPPGYTLVDGECILIDIVPADYTGGLVQVGAGAEKLVYSSLGLRLYPDISGLTLPIYGYGYAGLIPVPCTITIPYSVKDNNGLGSVVTPLLSSVKSKLWGCDASIPTCQTFSTPTNSGRLMTTGIWSPGYPEDVELSFEFCVNLDTTKQYLIGIAGDNKVKIYIDSVLHVFLDVDGFGACAETINTPFVYWHVFPITLTAGNHIIKLSGLNLGSEASFGAEIYDIDLATFQSTLTSPASAAPNCGNVPADVDPYVVFSTKDYIGQYIPDPNDPGVWTCPDGYTLDECNGIPQCVQITTVPVIPCNSYYTLNDCCTGQPAEYPIDFELQGVIYLLFNGNCLETACPDDLIGLIITEISNEAGINLTGCLELTEIPESEIPIDASTYPYENVFVEVVTVLTCQDCVQCSDICYILTDCENLLDPIYTLSSRVSPFVGGVNSIIINGYTNCWTVAVSEDTCDCAINVVVTQNFTNCELCLGYTSYKLTDCNNSANIMYTSTDLSEYVGQVIEQDCPGCWFVEEFFLQPLSDTAIIVTNVFDNCTTCGYTYYRLFDCAGVAEDIITTTDLSLLLNDIITLDWCPETCWQIEVTREHINATTVFIKDTYAACSQCFIDVLPCTCQTAKLVDPCVGYILTLPANAGTISYIECDGAVITNTYTNAFPFTLEFCGQSGQTFMSPIITQIDLSVECNFLSWIDCENRKISSADPVFNNSISPKMCIKQWSMPEGLYEYTTYGDCIDNNRVFECPVVPKLTRAVRPGYNTPTCTISHYEKIACSFADAMYSNALEKRYGITSCCPEDREKWEVKWELTELATLVQATPSIAPEPPFPPFPPPPVLKCVKYNISIFAPLGAAIYYLDCNSEVAVLVIPASKIKIIPPICGIEGQTTSTIYAIGGLNFSFTETAILC
jgi:hypothetical protein